MTDEQRDLDELRKDSDGDGAPDWQGSQHSGSWIGPLFLVSVVVLALLLLAGVRVLAG